jgi:protein TonB
MHAGGYLDRHVTANPSRLAIVIALHGAAITALMLAKSEIIKPTWFPPTIVEQIDAPEPPKPQEQQRTVDKPTVLVPSTTTKDDIPYFPPPRTDEGTAPTPLPPIALPVKVDARFVKGVEIQPDYPTSLARQEIEGYVTVRVLIGTDGRVRDVQQVFASDPEFFKATQRQAMRYWRFKPATQDGVPVESWQQMTVRFKLQS